MNRNNLKKGVLLILFGFVISCNSKSNKNSELKVLENENKTESIDGIFKSLIVKLNASGQDPDSLLAPSNEPQWKYPPKVKLLKYSSDTVYLKIINAYHLTQSMGTTGAEEYIDSISYSFIKIDGVNYVNLDFEAGDHASPGTFSINGYMINE